MDDSANDGLATRIADPLLVMRRVVDEALNLLPHADGAAVELLTDRTLTYVCAAGALSGSVGLQLPAGGSLSGLSLATGDVLRCDDAAADDRVDADACQRAGIRSMVCVPLVHGSEAIGVLKVSCVRPRAFSESDVTGLRRLSSFVSRVMVAWDELTGAFWSSGALGPLSDDNVQGWNEGASAEFMLGVLNPDAATWEYQRRRVSGLIDDFVAQTHTVFQPIVDVLTGEVVGCEALTRFLAEPARTPDMWFAEAHRVGLGSALEAAAAARALDCLASIPSGSYLAINVSADSASSADILDVIAQVDPSRIVLEITEHSRASDYRSLTSTLDRLRAMGFRIAVDDAGAGFAGLTHLLALRPDIVKLDRALICGIHEDPARQALCAAVQRFAEATSGHVVAEGVGSSQELATVRDLGIRYAQGFYIGRPGPLEALRAVPLMSRGRRRERGAVGGPRAGRRSGQPL